MIPPPQSGTKTDNYHLYHALYTVISQDPKPKVIIVCMFMCMLACVCVCACIYIGVCMLASTQHCGCSVNKQRG